ncbi:hypothetical protein GGS20DRAFT_583025 [Poronia punctata]|nr:hypothetical protein GGS20DRAFT_583025 [Poronia punctata]
MASKVPKRPSTDPPAARSRSDSFLRMLELEKLCKMQRIQHDHASSSTSQPPRSTPSVAANPSTPRSRRASAYPPLSHQTQIMKAVRRSAALPSLSLSIPQSPTKAFTMSLNGSREDSPATKDRAKNVTFSEPEDQDQSDNSSICQSPSWEQYGQKKKKKPKKRVTEKPGSEKEGAVLKRKGNRLVKTAPIDPSISKRITTSDRSISAPELDSSLRSGQKREHPLTASPQFVMTKQQESGSGPGPEPSPKPKSRGFLSGFRLQHGNVAAVQKIIESRKGADDADQDETLRSIQYETIPAQQPGVVPPATGSRTQNTRKPPSVRSSVSISDQSLSSQEKRRSSGTRTSTGSGHGRSQSLLSSTLNKLRGPSYLYYRPSEEMSSGDVSKKQSRPQNTGTTHASSTPGDGTKQMAGERSQPTFEHSQHRLDFAFPAAPNKQSTEPGPDIAPRGRPPRPRKYELQPGPQALNVDQATRGPSGDRSVQLDEPQASTRESVMAMGAAQERQFQAIRPAQQTISGPGSDFRGPGSVQGIQENGTESERRRVTTRNQRRETQWNKYGNAISVNVIEERFAENEGKATPNRSDRLAVGDKYSTEDDQVSIGTHASTIRPASQNHESAPAERRNPNLAQQDGSTPKSYTAEPTGPQAFGDSVGDLISFEKEASDTLQQPLKPQRDVDYFASFSDSFTLPVLDLRSPGEDKFSSSLFFETFRNDEGSNSNPREHATDGHDKEPANMNAAVPEAARAIQLHAKELGRVPKEQKAKSSPTSSTQYSDSDVPAFERLGLSSKAAKILAGADTASTSTVHSQHTDPSRTTSERSSSSTYDDAPPSPASVTTPDSSRPQSRKGGVASQPEPSQATLLYSVPQGDGKTRRNYPEVQLSQQPDDMAEYHSTILNSGSALSGLDPDAMAAKSARQARTTFVRPEGLAAMSFADIVQEDTDEASEQEQDVSQHPAPALPLRAQSALDLHSVTRPLQYASRQPRLLMKPSGVASSISLPSSPPPELVDSVVPRKSALRMSRNNSSNGVESGVASMGGAYLQEARKAAPLPSPSAPRALRPAYSQKNSSGSIKSGLSQARAEPLAKMLVECCNCHFFHDMPSRVYECMAKPDSVVEDKSLGVSAAITTMVRCPWCSHGMTTQCCAGYAAVVYLKEKLHGK